MVVHKIFKIEATKLSNQLIYFPLIPSDVVECKKKHMKLKISSLLGIHLNS